MFAFRGVAVVNAAVSDRELENMHEAGVRGVRINLSSATPDLTLAEGAEARARLKPLAGSTRTDQARVLDTPVTPLLDVEEG